MFPINNCCTLIDLKSLCRIIISLNHFFCPIQQFLNGLIIISMLFHITHFSTKIAVRIIFGVLLMNHGIQKWSNFQELSAVFPDPLGLGSPISLGLAIFGELVCSMAFIVGFLYRLAMIPMAFTMIVAFFIVHANDAFTVKELAFIYLIVFIIMYIAGPGKFSIDHIIGNEMARRKLKS